MNIRTEKIRYLDIHHTAGHEANTQAIRVEHMSPPNNWGDIGYNSVIEPNGTIGIGRNVKWDGAHDPGVPKGETHSMNQIAYAISHIGNFMEDTMSEVQFQASLNEAERVCRKYNIPIANVRKHKDQYATDCPGDKFPWDRYISELGKRLSGLNDTVKKVVVYYSSDDYSLALIASNKNGGCGMFNRNRSSTVHPDAIAAEKVINIGGPRLGHKNEVYWSGLDAEDTALIVLNGLRGAY